MLAGMVPLSGGFDLLQPAKKRDARTGSRGGAASSKTPYSSLATYRASESALKVIFRGARFDGPAVGSPRGDPTHAGSALSCLTTSGRRSTMEGTNSQTPQGRIAAQLDSWKGFGQFRQRASSLQTCQQERIV
jgi:hypothetical protein